MTDHGETSQRLSVPEAAAHLGLSVAAVRRMIRDGRAPAGIAYGVVLDSDHADGAGRSYSAQQVGTVARLNGSSGTGQETALAAWVVSLVAPLADANARQHETIERQAKQVADLRETIGRQGAELDRAMSTLAAQAEHYVRLGRQARRLQIGLAVAVFAVAGLLLAAGTLAAAGWAR